MQVNIPMFMDGWYMGYNLPIYPKQPEALYFIAQLSHEKKKTATFHYTGCLIGIPVFL